MSNLLQKAAHQEREANAFFKTRGRPITSANNASPATHGYLHELNPRSVQDKLNEAKENLVYWQAAKARAFTQRERDEAGARVQIWNLQLDAVIRRIREINQAATA